MAQDNHSVIFIDERQLAARWLVSHRTLQRRRSLGKMPRSVRVGQKVLYRIADVEAFETIATSLADQP